MQPNQVIPPPNPVEENPYDFILQSQAKPPKTILPTGGSRKQRIIIVVLGVFIIGLLFVLILGFISSQAAAPTKAMERIAQTQTEIVRVSAAGVTKARDTTTLGYAESISLTMTSSQKQTVRYLTAQHVKTSSKTLALGRNAATDADLKNADSAGRYDDQLLKVLEESLTTYKQQLTSAYGQTSNASQKRLLKVLYDQAVLMTKNQPTSS